MSSESAFKARCMKAYKLRYGCYVKKNEQLALIGDPDIFICHRGLFVAIELKKKGGKPRKKQVIVLQDIIRSGGIGGVADTLEKFMSIVELADKKADRLGVLTNESEKDKLLRDMDNY